MFDTWCFHDLGLGDTDDPMVGPWPSHVWIDDESIDADRREVIDKRVAFTNKRQQFQNDWPAIKNPFGAP